MTTSRNLSVKIALLMAALVIALLPVAAPAQTIMSEPIPSLDNPRRIMLQLTSDDPRAMNNILYNAVNLQKFYGIDNVKIAIVAFGPGMKALYKNSSPVQQRVESLLKYDVQFIGCGNTMVATNRSPADLILGVEHVTAGIAEIVERRLRGWQYIHP